MPGFTPSTAVTSAREHTTDAGTDRKLRPGRCRDGGAFPCLRQGRRHLGSTHTDHNLSGEGDQAHEGHSQEKLRAPGCLQIPEDCPRTGGEPSPTQRPSGGLSAPGWVPSATRGTSLQLEAPGLGRARTGTLGDNLLRKETADPQHGGGHSPRWRGRPSPKSPGPRRPLPRLHQASGGALPPGPGSAESGRPFLPARALPRPPARLVP